MPNPDEFITLATVQLEVAQLRGEVKALTNSTKDLVDAWNAASQLVKLVKLMAALVAAAGVVWVFIKHGFRAP